jgi:hypothetical protein
VIKQVLSILGSFRRLKNIKQVRSKHDFVHFYEENEPQLGTLFFVGGFVFDVLTLSRIDDTFTMYQHAVYLFIISIMLIVNEIHQVRPYNWPNWLISFWQYQDLVVHFLFGSLLSCYALFYFKSASLATSFVFMIFISFLMVANELPRFQKGGPIIKFALISLCFTSFLSYVVPIVLGWIGAIPFVLSVCISLSLSFVLSYFLNRKLPDPNHTRNLVILPSALVQIVFLALYLLKMIPPVPLAIDYAGIYHNVEKAEGRYVLSYDRPFWKFWQHGAQSFVAQSGDKIYVYVRVFSPTHFKDKVFIRWMFREPKTGWQSYDVIPLNIVGGRDQGFRGYAFKSNYTPGQWRVQIETADEREIGRISFDVEINPSADLSASRDLRVDYD